MYYSDKISATNWIIVNYFDQDFCQKIVSWKKRKYENKETKAFA